MVRRILLYTLAWLAVAVPSALVVTLNSARETTFAGHEVTVRPTTDGWATFDLGPYLPDFRHPSTGRIGVRVDVGKTTAEDYDTLVQRYAVIAAAPDSQIDKLREVVTGMLLRGALAGALIGVVAPLVVKLVGRERWYGLARRMTLHRAVAMGIAVTTVCTGLYVLFPASNWPEVEREPQSLDEQAPAGCRLEVPDGRGQIAPDQLGVPVDPVERAGDDVLRCGVDRPGEGDHPVIHPVRPGPVGRRPPGGLHHLVGHAAEEQSVGAGQALGPVAVRLLVGCHRLVVDAAVERDVDRIAQRSHGRVTGRAVGAHRPMP